MDCITSHPISRPTLGKTLSSVRRWPEPVNGDCHRALALRFLFSISVSFKSAAQLRHDGACRFDVLELKPFRKSVDPGRLQAHGRVKRLPSLVGQDDELCPTVMRVGLEADQAFLLQIVDN